MVLRRDRESPFTALVIYLRIGLCRPGDLMRRPQKVSLRWTCTIDWGIRLFNPRTRRQKERGMSGRAIIRVLLACMFVLIGLVLLGFTGSLFAPGDAVAVIRPQAGVLLIPLAAILWSMKARRAAIVSLTMAVLAIGSVGPGFLASRTDCPRECLKLYQKNLLSKAWPRYSLADDIIASDAEIVTLQEVSEHNREYMANLFAHYPFAVTCKFRPAQDVAVLTSLPAVDGSGFCLAGAGMAGLQVLAPNGQLIWLVSVHLEWPFPFDQFRQSQIIAKKIADLGRSGADRGRFQHGSVGRQRPPDQASRWKSISRCLSEHLSPRKLAPPSTDRHGLGPSRGNRDDRASPLYGIGSSGRSGTDLPALRLSTRMSISGLVRSSLKPEGQRRRMNSLEARGRTSSSGSLGGRQE